MLSIDKNWDGIDYTEIIQEVHVLGYMGLHFLTCKYGRMGDWERVHRKYLFFIVFYTFDARVKCQFKKQNYIKLVTKILLIFLISSTLL